MKILILSPLFPPDTGAPAAYVKELAQRLKEHHEPALLVYGYLPEAIEGVSVHSVDKRRFLPFRLLAFAGAIVRQHAYDVAFINNAPSIELPFLLVSLFRRTPYVLIESDPIAYKAAERGLYKLLHEIVKNRAQKVIVLEGEASYKKAEVLPFEEFNATSEARRQTWWQSHCNSLLS